MTESQLSKKATTYLQTKYNAYVVNVVQASKNGVSDLLCCIDGSFYAFELKAPTGRASKLQLAHGMLVEKSGGRFAIVKSLDDIDNLIAGTEYNPWRK